MINDPLHAEEALARENESSKRKLLAVVCAVAVTAVLLVGYGYIRKYHAQRVIAENTSPPDPDSGPKGPPLAHIVIDEPTLEKGMTTIGGVVLPDVAVTDEENCRDCYGANHSQQFSFT